jgi:hypothetical protein
METLFGFVSFFTMQLLSHQRGVFEILKVSHGNSFPPKITSALLEAIIAIHLS